MDQRRREQLADDTSASSLGEELRGLIFELDPSLRGEAGSWWAGVIDSVLL